MANTKIDTQKLIGYLDDLVEQAEAAKQSTTSATAHYIEVGRKVAFKRIKRWAEGHQEKAITEGGSIPVLPKEVAAWVDYARERGLHLKGFLRVFGVLPDAAYTAFQEVRDWVEEDDANLRAATEAFITGNYFVENPRFRLRLRIKGLDPDREQYLNQHKDTGATFIDSSVETSRVRTIFTEDDVKHLDLSPFIKEDVTDE